MLLKVQYNEGIDTIYTQSVFQYDTGLSILVEGMPITIPMTIDISNTKERGNAIRYRANGVPIPIPDDFFKNGEYVYIWIHGANETMLVIIPVKTRSVPVASPNGDEGGSTKPTYEYDEDDENLILFRGLNDLVSQNTEDE